jgi:hypothetical protein
MVITEEHDLSNWNKEIKISFLTLSEIDRIIINYDNLDLI